MVSCGRVAFQMDPSFELQMTGDGMGHILVGGRAGDFASAGELRLLPVRPGSESFALYRSGVPGFRFSRRCVNAD